MNSRVSWIFEEREGEPSFIEKVIVPALVDDPYEIVLGCCDRFNLLVPADDIDCHSPILSEILRASKTNVGVQPRRVLRADGCNALFGGLLDKDPRSFSRTHSRTNRASWTPSDRAIRLSA